MDIRAYLKSGRPLLFDGAMGTYFAAQPGNAGQRCELASLSDPQKITAIHKAYLDAGSRAIKTNTFAVSGDVARGDTALAARLIAAACTLATAAAAPYDAAVFADIGPVGEDSPLPAQETYTRQAELFLAQGLRCFLVETLPGDEGIAGFAAALKAKCPEAFLLVSYAVMPEGFTRDGRPGAELLRSTAALGQVDAVGFNCVSGPAHLLQLVKTLAPLGKYLSVMPNAGYPTVLGRRTVFGGTPAYFAEKTAAMAQSGATLLGGCCGTTPAHIAALATALAGVKVVPPALRPAPAAAPPATDANPLRAKLESGKRLIAVELDPPKDDCAAPFLESVRQLKAAGVDAITLADCPIGRPRADSSLLACKLKRELGVEPLPHLTCRDRNLNATKALLLGLAMEGVHNVLLVTGDPIPTADRDEVKGVFNFNSRKLAAYVRSLNETALSTPFQIFGALNLNARNFAVQLRLAQEKEANGVQGFLTQPVLCAEALENLKTARSVLKGKILGGIYPIVSYKNAVFMNNEISGMRVAEEIVALYRDKTREEAQALAVRISTVIAQEIAPYTDGVYLMTPFNRVTLVTEILQGIR